MLYTSGNRDRQIVGFIQSAKWQSREGSPKYKGGIGLHTTGISKRRFLPNLQTVRTTDGKGNTKRMCICTRCLKSGKVKKA